MCGFHVRISPFAARPSLKVRSGVDVTKAADSLDSMRTVMRENP